MQPVTPIAGLVLSGAYRLDFPLGEGGFGAVWRATEVATGALVAVKFLKRGFDRVGFTRFEREAQALARIDHPNCVRFIASGYAEELGGAFLATEFVDGETLAAWSRRPHTLEVTLDVAIQLADALAAAHRAGVVHRDLKPSNVMLTPGPTGLFVKVLDFGIARLAGVEQGDITKTGEIIGTPGYMSPEQLRGEREIRPAADLYAFGAMLYELLAGRPVFVGSTALEIAMQHIFQPPVPLGPAVPAPLAALTLRLLAKTPPHRPPSAASVASELRAILHGAPSTPMPHRTALPDERPRRGVAAVVGTLAALGAAGVAYLAAGGVDEQAPRPLPPSYLAPQPAVASGAPVRVPPEPTPAPDFGSPIVRETTPKPSRGCGIARPDGLQHVELVQDLLKERPPQAPYRAYLPQDYDPDYPHPLLVLFHQVGGSNADTVRADLQLDGWADQHRVILLSVYVHGEARPVNKGGWTPDTLDFAERVIEARREELCVDERRVFLFGQVGGGQAAERIACRRSDIAGVITFATWRAVAENRCRNREGPIPILAMYPLRDPAEPPEGGGKRGVCGRELQSAPLEEGERQLRLVNRCRDERRPYFEAGEGICYTWDCDALTASCHLDGGRDWGRPDRTPEPHCWAPVAEFPYGDLLWRFMQDAVPQGQP